MIEYSLAFVFCAVSMLLPSKLKKVVCMMVLVYLGFLSGTRYELGGKDYFEYEFYFYNYPHFSDFLYYLLNDRAYLLSLGHNVSDFGFVCFMSLLKTIGFNYYGFIFFHSLVFYLCFYFGLKRYCRDWSLLIPFFVYKLFFYNTFVSMRQSLTLAVFFLAFRYLEEGRALKYFLSIFFACLFHIAAIVLLPVYFVRFFKISWFRLILLNFFFLPTTFFSSFSRPLLSILAGIVDTFGFVRFSGWLEIMDSENYRQISLSQTLEWVIIMVIIILYYKKIRMQPHSFFIIKIFLLLLPIYTFLRSFIFFIRIRDYFIVTYGLILGYVWSPPFENTGKGNYLFGLKLSELLVRFSILIILYIGTIIGIMKFDNGHFFDYRSFLFEGLWIWGAK